MVVCKGFCFDVLGGVDVVVVEGGGGGGEYVWGCEGGVVVGFVLVGVGVGVVV